MMSGMTQDKDNGSLKDNGIPCTVRDRYGVGMILIQRQRYLAIRATWSSEDMVMCLTKTLGSQECCVGMIGTW